MRGSLALCRGIVYVARSARTVEIRSYDLDGVPTGRPIVLGPLGASRAQAAGLAVDPDRRLLVADPHARAVRVLNTFGVEGRPLAAGTEADAPGDVGIPSSVATQGVEAEAVVLVGSRGERRLGVQLFDRAGRPLAALRSRGEAARAFQDVRHVALDGRFQTVCEAGSGLVQVFRAGEFHFAFRPPSARRADRAALATAAHRLADGRFVIATEGEGADGVHLVSSTGALIHTIARAGERTGDVRAPSDLVVEESERDRRARLVVVDHEGERVQVFNLEGVCYGAFADLAGAPDGVEARAEESS